MKQNLKTLNCDLKSFEHSFTSQYFLNISHCQAVRQDLRITRQIGDYSFLDSHKVAGERKQYDRLKDEPLEQSYVLTVCMSKRGMYKVLWGSTENISQAHAHTERFLKRQGQDNFKQELSFIWLLKEKLKIHKSPLDQRIRTYKPREQQLQ